jgi:phosphotransferase system  glucose/maltose/N-acetylglucosamine-specific IIC component
MRFMQNQITGAILLSSAAGIVAIGVVGAQVANAIVLGQFYVAKMSGETPPSPSRGIPHPLILVAAGVLAVFAVYFLFRSTCRSKHDKRDSQEQTEEAEKQAF